MGRQKHSKDSAYPAAPPETTPEPDAIPAKEAPYVVYRMSDSDTRPWGSWRVIDTGAGHIVKHIEITPGQRLSLQYHNHRTEHWICVAGRGTATIGARAITILPGKHVHIPQREAHRIANTGVETLHLVEIQLGTRLDESDIVRIEDDYGRHGSGQA